MDIRHMSVKQWIAVTPNPIQRDTERHAAKAKHLLTPLGVHAVVHAAELMKDDTLVKLDGHTRALMWARNQMRHPPEVIVMVTRVRDIEEAKELYRTFDSKDALETTTDKVLGAFGAHQFHPESGLLKAGNITNAMKMCFHIFKNEPINTGPVRRALFDIYKCIDEFTNELLALDSFGIGTQNKFVTGGIIAAFVLTYRRHGMKALPFWQAYFADTGQKNAGKMDGVQALRELILTRAKGQGGLSYVTDLTARAVMAVEKWLKDDMLSAVPRAYDLAGYIDHMKPAVQLIKSPANTQAAKARASVHA